MSMSDTQTLEERFQDRNLKFTQSFVGLEPVQAYGTVDKDRFFYFRLRGDTASLLVGEHIPETIDNPSKLVERNSNKSVYPNHNTVLKMIEGVGTLETMFTSLLDLVPVQHSSALFKESEIELASANYENQLGLIDGFIEALENDPNNTMIVAARLGIPVDELVQYVYGNRDMTMTELRLLATSLGVEITYSLVKP